MADAEWERFKAEIERLYILENKTLPQVMNAMESMYGFERSKQQYQRRLKKWGLKKYELRAADWKAIGRRVEKRKREDGKESEVFFDGIQHPPEKVRKVSYKQAFVSIRDQFLGGPSPYTPEGVVVCTPASPGMRLEWDASLPWLRFSKLLQTAQGQDNVSFSLAASPRSAEVSSHKENLDLMQILGSIVPWHKLSQPPNIKSSSRIATALSILMPEDFEGQHHTLSERLCDINQTGMDRLHLELFLLSNNLASQVSSELSYATMNSNDKRIMQMFKRTGWTSLKRLQILLSTPEPTSGAIAEQIFASALRLVDLDTVETMLRAGMDPNNPIETVRHGALTPLQFSASIAWEGINLMDLLLSHDVDVNLSYNGYSALHYAIRSENEEAMRALLSHGAVVSPTCLRDAAIYDISIEIFRDFVDACEDDIELTGWEDILAEAVKSRNVAMINILLAKGANVNFLVDVRFDDHWETTTVLGLGVTSKKVEIIEPLLRACVNVNPDVDELDDLDELHELSLVSPLALAVETGCFKITQLLLEANLDVGAADCSGKLTLLERAVKKTNVDLCGALIAHGAKVDRPWDCEGQSSSALLIALEMNSLEIVNLLINCGARLNDVYSRAPGTVLGAAIEKGDRALLRMLQRAGASVLPPKLRRIGNMETAIYLQQSGILQGILQICGRTILTAAILAKDNELVQYLLDDDININILATAADIDHSEPEQTPLGAAIQTGNSFVAEAILQRDARVTDSDLSHAVAASISDDNGTQLLERLLTGFVGKAPTAVGNTILNGRRDLLQLILKAGVDPTGAPQLFEDVWNLDEFDLDTPESVLEIAAEQGDRSMLQILLQSAQWDPRSTGRALAIAVFFDQVDLAEDLLNFGPDVNQEITLYYPDEEDEYGEVVKARVLEVLTPLQAAVKNQQVAMVRKLAEQADINYLGKGDRRRTALQHAVDIGNMELVNMLLAHGADINGAPARYGGATALQIAAIRGYLGIARRLIDLGADVNAAPAKFTGRTALEAAAEHGRIDMLQMLLNGGASITGDGKRQYQRALDFAERNGHNAAAKLLTFFKHRAQSSSP
ncbi:hypothetical protein Asppvi_011129 [Aspergillus pseudoviridinutans]|uniref:Clr5 domain-containing protein n=1 Tax=Aspergillus pseudoviridinutans TaxID=1517512 RepID=A0A9P3F0M6_9EURO|nr:uncharacterized protein Asppvi_011129 [Aspergillus pseudoviridinutans]GIJ92153.1 hypothetical protein Asppvi_011129 [Aspergillus pseudoviridinutans]